MSGTSIWSVLKIGFSAIGKLIPIGRRLCAERKSGQTPQKPIDRAEQLLDEALERLGSINSNDPVWKKTFIGLGAAISRPEQFENPYVREWLSQYDVGSALKSAAKCRTTGGPVDEKTYELLIDTYVEKSGEARRHAENVVDTALAFLQASLQFAATDAGTAGLVQAGFEGVNRRFEVLEEKIAKEHSSLFEDGILSEHHGTDAKRELDTILKRRASPQHDTLAELEQLAFDLGEKGKYRAAHAAIKGEVFSWIARTAAVKGNVEVAEWALQESNVYGTYDRTIIDAWLDVSQGEKDNAIRRLRDRDDSDSRSNLFAILWQKQGVNDALTFFDSLSGHPSNQFTGIGWRNLIACLIADNRMPEAIDTIDSLPESLVTECPMLGYVQGVIYSTNLVSEAHRHRIINEQFLAVSDHLLEGADVDQWRTAAADAFTRAKLAAEAVQDKALPTMATNWLRWLNLIDPDQQEKELAALKDGMEDGACAIDLINFAVAFDVAFDPAPLEKFLIRAEGLGGLSRKELNAKLLLFKSTHRFEELARFIEENWECLVEESNAAGITGFLIEALVACGNWRRAEEVLKAKQEFLYALDIPRYQLMIDHCKGHDPTKRALENYESTSSIEDLWNLVKGLEFAKRWGDLVPYAEKLFDSDPTGDNALRYIRCLSQIGEQEEKIVSFLEQIPDLIERYHELKSARAWALYRLGRVEESRTLNDQLLTSRHHVNDVGLDVNIAMRLGEWERFTDILGKEWERRSELPVALLLHLAKLAGSRSPERAIQLAQEAVERDPANPQVLLQAHGIATALARDDIGMPWVHQAAALSMSGEGPVQAYSFREVVEMMKNNADDWRRKNDLFRTGQIPLHWAAPMFNMPLSRFLVATPRENLEQPDARKRFVIPVRSGARKKINTAGINTLALDITSIFILSELDLLDAAIEVLEGIFVSPRVMELLLYEREKVEFHQPSRVRAAKPLLEMRHAGRLSIIVKKCTEALAAEVGEEEAALLETAKEVNGVCIHGGRLYKVGSFMDEEAELGDFARYLAVPSAIAVTLHDEGRLGTDAYEKAKTYLDNVGGEYTGSSLPPDAPVCLDRVSAQYLSEAGIMIPLINSGRKVLIHPSAAEEWEALVATERHTAIMMEALESMRRSLRNGISSGKVWFLREGRKDDEGRHRFGLAELPVMDLLEDLRQVDAVCIDERFLNAHPLFTDKKGRSVPLLCSLDIVDLLFERERMGKERFRSAIHTMRQWGFFALPLAEDELFDLLAAREIDDSGGVKESAELRAIRENLARVHSADVLSTDTDLNYLDHLWQVGFEVIRKLWSDESVPQNILEARADWVFDHVIPDCELALRFARDKEDRIEPLAVGRLIAFLLPGIAYDRRDQYAEWLEKKVVATYVPANSKVITQAVAEIVRLTMVSSKEVANELRKSGCIDDDTEPTEDNF